jgi:DNA polymerase III subunit alpha
VAALKETSTKGGNRMAFVTLEDMAGTVEVTVFPEPFKLAAEHLRGRQPVIVRGRIDDADKGRVVLAEDVRPLEAALAADGRGAVKSSSEPNAVRVRIRPAGDPQESVAALRTICGSHPGPVPVFVHLLLGAQEVVVRTRGLAVDAAPELVAELDERFGSGAATVDHA